MIVAKLEGHHRPLTRRNLLMMLEYMSINRVREYLQSRTGASPDGVVISAEQQQVLPVLLSDKQVRVAYYNGQRLCSCKGHVEFLLNGNDNQAGHGNKNEFAEATTKTTSMNKSEGRFLVAVVPNQGNAQRSPGACATLHLKCRAALHQQIRRESTVENLKTGTARQRDNNGERPRYMYAR